MITNIPPLNEAPKSKQQKADPRHAALLYLPGLPIPGVKAAIEKELQQVLKDKLGGKCPACGQELPK